MYAVFKQVLPPSPGQEVASCARTSLFVITAFLPGICKVGREKPQQIRQSSLSDRPALSQIKEQTEFVSWSG